MELTSGEIVGERYRMVGEIASGGMGSVYRVERMKDGTPFAFKVIRRDLSPGAETIERFKREARLLEEVAHEGVVQMVDAGLLRDGSAFLVMELLEGETLLDFLRRESPVTATELVPIVKGIARALDAVHAQGIVHRDLKPSNVFLTKNEVKLVDFGIAYATNATRLTMTGHVVGTLRYMAPEQLMGETVDNRTDVYALGVIVWGALAGGPPFVGQGMNAAQEILSGVPRVDREVSSLSKELGDVVARATARRRDARFTSAGAFAKAFERVAAAAPRERPRRATGFAPIPTTRTGQTAAGVVTSVSMPEDRTTSESIRTRRRRSRGARLAAGIGSVAVVIIAIAVLFSVGFDDDEGPRPLADATPPPPPVVEAEVEVDDEPARGKPGPSVAADRIRIDSDPRGALVLQEGRTIGRTPVDVAPSLDQKESTLSISLDGYGTTRVSITRHSQRRIVVNLKEMEDPRRRTRSAMRSRRPAMRAPSYDVLDPFAD